MPQPDYKYSAKNIHKDKSMVPKEDEDYFISKQYDCAVIFEIHVRGSEDEDDIDIECRAYDAASKGGDLECLGVMAKDPHGVKKVDFDNNPFDEEKWIKAKVKEFRANRLEIPLTGFFQLGI